MAKINGVWKFNVSATLTTPNWTSQTIIWVSVKHPSVYGNIIKANSAFLFMRDTSVMFSAYNFNTSKWNSDYVSYYELICFSSEQEVSDEFYAWWTTNATKQESRTEITYNGITASVEDGKTATLVCSGKKAVTDIVVKVETSSMVTYNGEKTEIKRGKTATLECAGKRMKTDVVVERKVATQEYEIYKGGWFISGESVYTTSDPVVTYAFPVEAGATYTITMTEIGNRLCKAFTAVDPATFAGGETNVLTQFVNDASSLAVGYSFEYTATADGWYFIYVSNKGETPNIRVLMSG